MPYYDTIEEDLARAKKIIEAGRMSDWEIQALDKLKLPDDVKKRRIEQSGTIYPADIVAAYQILKSLVAEVERLRTVLPTKSTAQAKKE